MTRKTWLAFTAVLVLAGTLGLLGGLALARGSAQAGAQANTAPTVVSYQGEVRVDGMPYTGKGFFKFAVVDAGSTTSYWSNDETSVGGGEPASAILLDVQGGLFAVLLGDDTLTNMQTLPAGVFVQGGRYLRVWFAQAKSGPYTDLGLTAIASVPYAFNAELLDGLDGSAYQQRYEHVIAVAKSGGDYATIGAALDAIVDNGAGNRYLLWVAPGTYTETVRTKPYVSIQGAGRELTTIVSDSSSSSFIWPEATVVLTDHVTLRDVAVTASGPAVHPYRIAIQAHKASAVEVRDVIAVATGAQKSYGILNYKSSMTIRGATITAIGSANAYGINNYQGTTAIHGTSTYAHGDPAHGVSNLSATTTMENVAALGRNTNADGVAHGIYATGSTVAVRDTEAQGDGTHSLCAGYYEQKSDEAVYSEIRDSVLSGAVGIYSECTLTSKTCAANTLQNVTATGERYGLYTQTTLSSTQDLFVDGCRLTGETIAAAYTSVTEVYVGASKLDGAAVKGATGGYHCAGAYDGAYAPLNATCQP